MVIPPQPLATIANRIHRIHPRAPRQILSIFFIEKFCGTVATSRTERMVAHRIPRNHEMFSTEFSTGAGPAGCIPMYSKVFRVPMRSTFPWPSSCRPPTSVPTWPFPCDPWLWVPDWPGNGESPGKVEENSWNSIAEFPLVRLPGLVVVGLRKSCYTCLTCGHA